MSVDFVEVNNSQYDFVGQIVCVAFSSASHDSIALENFRKHPVPVEGRELRDVEGRELRDVEGRELRDVEGLSDV